MDCPRELVKKVEDQRNPLLMELNILMDQGTLQVFTFDGTEDDQDLMEFRLNNSYIITDLINSEVSNAAKKLQFVSSLDLYIEEFENDNGEQAIEILL